MNESDGGFSFGRPDETHNILPASDEVDAIEVSGEPVSRSEAKNMGIVTRDPKSAAATRDDKSATTLMRLDQLPKDLSGELTNKLEAAWNHLKRNEIEEAVTLAQEVVFEYPALVAPKIIIARCFINRKEYKKALSILQAIGESEMNSETMYYIGLCQSRLGRIGEAMETLKLARASSTDTIIRKRAGDLMQHLQGEQTVCPVCGKKSLYDSMVEVGNQTVCANCAKTMGEDEDDGDDDEYDDEWEDEGGYRRGRRRKKRLRPPLSKTDIALRVVFGCFLLALAWLGLYILSLASPSMYSSVRSFIPDWSLLPAAQHNSYGPKPQAPANPAATRIVSSIQIDSPPLSRAIAGVELRHQVFIESPENREWEYSVSVYPMPVGDFGLESKTGDFRWTPADADVGKTFEIMFSATLKNHRARDQINQVMVSPGPRFENAVNWTSPRPGEARQMTVADLNNDGRQDLILASGAFWEGEVVVFDISDDAETESKRVASARLPGRPVGLGVILADDERWISVADYWNSRLRYYALRGGNLSEMAVDISLPGRPILTAFDTKSSTTAVICRNDDANHLLVYRQVGQLRSEKVGDWTVPDAFVWRRILLLPGVGDNSNTISRFLLFGGDAGESVYLVDEGDADPILLKLGISGMLVDAAADNDGEVFCLVKNDNGLQLYRFTLDEDKDATLVGPVNAGGNAALGGFAVLPTDGQDAPVAFVLSTTSLGLSIASSGAGGDWVHYWPLPRPAMLLGQAVVIPGDRENAPRVAYFDDDGGVWSVDISVPKPGVEEGKQ